MPNLPFTRKQAENFGYYGSLIGLLLYFLVKTIYFAFHIKTHMAPDEVFHLRFIHAFYEVSGFTIPLDPKYVVAGPIQTFPYLYHLILGKLLHLNFFPISDMIFIRLLNILLSLFTLSFFYLTLKELVKSRAAHVLALSIHTNLLMFTFLSASANYDNLGNLLATFAIYQLVLWIKHHRLNNLSALLIGGGASLLVKYSMIPFFFLLLLVIVIDLWREMKGKISEIKPFITNLFKGLKWHHHLPEIILLGTIAFSAVKMYSYNKIEQGRWVPTCSKTYSIELCKKHNWSYQNSSSNSRHKRQPQSISRLEQYVSRWFELMVERTFGLLVHTPTKARKQVIIFGKIIMFLFIFSLIRHATFKEKPLTFLTAMMLAYTFILLFLVNYRAYRTTGIVHLAVHGRYLFPLLPAFIICFVVYFLRNFKTQVVKSFAAILFASLFVIYELPYFLKDDDWSRVMTDYSSLSKEALPKTKLEFNPKM